MKSNSELKLSKEQRQEVGSWIEKNSADLPESVRIFLAPHRKYLLADSNLQRQFAEVVQLLRRAMGITPSSERRKSGDPLACVPKDKLPKSLRERLIQKKAHSERLCVWHDKLHKSYGEKVVRIGERLAKMPIEDIEEDLDNLEEIELSPEKQAESKALSKIFVENLCLGDGADPILQSAQEALMPEGSVLWREESVKLKAAVPAELAKAQVVKTLTDKRVRYDLSLAVTRIELDVEKKVLINNHGERQVISASTKEYGPPRYTVTWSALANIVVMVGQFCIPFNRLATMISTAVKSFTTGSLSRMFHYVARRFLPVYLELAEQLADSKILAGDDTSCRVLEVTSYFANWKIKKPHEKPWADFQTPEIAEASFKHCEEERKSRLLRIQDGDVQAKQESDEGPSLGVLIGQALAFESPRRDGNGPKQALNITVLSGRSVENDPKSLIVFYRSHIGSCGDLMESILENRNTNLKEVILQADLSSTNLVTSPQLLKRFSFRLIGCSAHARRPFAVYEQEDPLYCGYMLHLFKGLAIHESRLDVHGRNFKNVHAVRQSESRRMWLAIKKLAGDIAKKWSKATKLGTAARYILNHYEKLTAYLDDPRLEPTNNLRERMLRMEKLIENGSMFRKSLEGRFALDIVRTILQTAVASEVPVLEYLISVLKSDPEEVRNHPERFTPRSWSERQAAAQN